MDVRDFAAARAVHAGYRARTFTGGAVIRDVVQNDLRLAGSIAAQTGQPTGSVTVDTAHHGPYAYRPSHTRHARKIGLQLCLDFGGALANGLPWCEIGQFETSECKRITLRQAPYVGSELLFRSILHVAVEV